MAMHIIEAAVPVAVGSGILAIRRGGGPGSNQNEPLPLLVGRGSFWLRMICKEPRRTALLGRSGALNRLNLVQRLLEVGDEVAHCFDSDRQADEVRRGAGFGLLTLGELGVGGSRRMDDE